MRDLVLETPYSTSADNIWDAVVVQCTVNSEAASSLALTTLQLTDTGNRYNLTVSGGPVTSSDGSPAATVILSSLAKNYQDLAQTVFFGHSLQLRAAAMICSRHGRLKHICNDCRL